MKKSKVILGILLCSLLNPMYVLADTQREVNQEAEVSPKFAVSKYVELEKKYSSLSVVPQYYPYSYYDHDFKTTLRGTLVLYHTVDVGTYVIAYYSGHCSGSI